MRASDHFSSKRECRPTRPADRDHVEVPLPRAHSHAVSRTGTPRGRGMEGGKGDLRVRPPGERLARPGHLAMLCRRVGLGGVMGGRNQLEEHMASSVGQSPAAAKA